MDNLWIFTLPKTNLCNFLKYDLISRRNKEGWVCIVTLWSQEKTRWAFASKALALFLALSVGSAAIYLALAMPDVLKNNAVMSVKSVILFMLITGWAAFVGRSNGLSPMVAVGPFPLTASGKRVG